MVFPLHICVCAGCILLHCSPHWFRGGGGCLFWGPSKFQWNDHFFLWCRGFYYYSNHFIVAWSSIVIHDMQLHFGRWFTIIFMIHLGFAGRNRAQFGGFFLGGLCLMACAFGTTDSAFVMTMVFVARMCSSTSSEDMEVSWVIGVTLNHPSMDFPWTIPLLGIHHMGINQDFWGI